MHRHKAENRLFQPYSGFDSYLYSLSHAEKLINMVVVPLAAWERQLLVSWSFCTTVQNISTAANQISTKCAVNM